MAQTYCRQTLQLGEAQAATDVQQFKLLAIPLKRILTFSPVYSIANILGGL